MLKFLEQLKDEYNEAFKDADPHSRYWLLISNSPIPVWILSCLYIAMIFFGPKIMNNRQPFRLQKVMVVYNLGLVALSTYMFIEIIASSIAADYGLFCSKYGPESWDDPKETRVARVLWWYFFSKAIELNDTLLMILRKKSNQISFLHVFHHVSMMNIWWWVMMFTPGGCAVYGSCLNCLVHVVMYTYYGLSAIPSLRQRLWWKRYITRFQLIQFIVTFSHTCYAQRINCDFPAWGLNLLRNYMVIMIVLFANFYIHAYVLRKRPNDRKTRDASPVTMVTDNCEMSSSFSRDPHTKYD